MLRSPYVVRRTLPQTQTREAVFGLHEIGKLVEELNALKERVATEHATKLAEIDADHQTAMARIEEKIAVAHAHIATIQKGEKGEPGRSPAPLDEGAIVARVLSKIRPPKDGETPVVDYNAIAQKAAKLIKVPKPENGKDAVLDHNQLADAVLEKLMKEKKLKPDHIAGLGLELSGIRNHVMMRGGGDTVAAGSNITISMSGGVKTISSTGGASLSVLAATGTIDDSNKTFTFASTPTLIIVNGAVYRNGSGVTIVATTATLDNVVGTGGMIFGLG